MWTHFLFDIYDEYEFKNFEHYFVPWTLKNLDPGKPRPWKTWTLKNLDLEKHGKRLDMEKWLEEHIL